MSKFKHTKGPYRTINYGTVTTIEAVDGQTVCDVHFPNNPNSQANIKMILAMDEMFEALIEAAELFGQYAQEHEKKGNMEKALKNLEMENKLIKITNKASSLTWSQIQGE